LNSDAVPGASFISEVPASAKVIGELLTIMFASPKCRGERGTPAAHLTPEGTDGR
jgi:hypothetical protein